MLDAYSGDPLISDAKLAAQRGVSRNRIASIKSRLAEQAVIVVADQGIGRPKQVTVNGHKEAFVNGEIDL